METNLNDNLKNTSVSVLMINSQGMMLSVLGNDYFVSYNRVPWLRNARISSALNVRMAGKKRNRMARTGCRPRNRLSETS